MHSLSWDFDRVLVYIPYLDFPIYWYGFLFALGILWAQYNLKKNLISLGLESDKSFQDLVFKIVLAIAFGARLFDVIFYQDVGFFIKHPLEILNFREGGLASHGGVIGFLIVLTRHVIKHKRSFMSYLSKMLAPCGILFFFIRMGNLFNQEILGKPYSGFMSLIFKNPLDGSQAIARHPVVIYEAICYLLIGKICQKLKTSDEKKVGYALLSFFGARLLLETLKEEQSIYIMPFGLTMGMILSMPFILWGVYLIFFRKEDKQYKRSQLKHQGEA
jgi:prolipoprotein diacylglyceryl transferase